MRRTNPLGVVRRITCVTHPAASRAVTRPVHSGRSLHAVSRDPAGATRSHPPLPRLGLPAERDRSVLGTLVSLGVHGLLLLLLVAPITLRDDPPIIPMEQGAGGEGPAGGGGGGTGGTGGDGERVQYVAVAPPPAAVAPAVEAPPVVPPPVQEPPTPVPEPVVTPPVTPSPAPAATPSTVASTPAPMPGVGGGTGNDGTAGSGPGTGGGVGSGVGTGRGSGTGPGTGGGTQANYPPTPTEMFLPPLPAPSNVKGFRLIAEFDVDSTGRVLDFTFTQTRNGGYNRQLRDVLRSIRFRPGTRPDGTPIRMKAQLEYTFF